MPRSTWRRVYQYRVDRLPMRGMQVYTPMSRDAPMGEEDARFWDWIASALVVGFAVAVGLVAFGWPT